MFGYHRNKRWSTSFAPRRRLGPLLGLHRAGPLGRGARPRRPLLAHDRPLGNAIRNTIQDWAREERLEAYDQATAKGYLRHLVVREGRNTGQALVQLVTHAWRERVLDRERFFAIHEVLTAFPEVRSIHWAVNDTPAEITNLPSELLWGEEAIEEELGGLRFRVRPNAFLQTNTRMAERLYDLARDAAGLTGTETVFDLYCGIGTIGLSLARDAMTVWGVEISEESVACAIENAELNSIGNAAFFAGNVGDALRELRERAGAPDVVVADPPRAGLAGKALRRLGELAAPRVVYASPATRRRLPGTRRCCVRSTATTSSASGRWTCSRTPRTSRRSCAVLERAQPVGDLSARGAGRRRQSRSAFGARKPTARPAASAGRPLRPHQIASDIVAPNEQATGRPRSESREVRSGSWLPGTARRRTGRAGRGACCRRAPET